jgi:dsRNA-specific ribonuclease
MYEFQTKPDQAFMCRCKLLDLKCFGLGHGKNKKAAKSEAAQKAIEMIVHISDV